MTGRAALVALLAATTACGARTGLNDQPYEPASLYCTDALFTGRPSRDLALVVGLSHRLRGLRRAPCRAAPARPPAH